jgi:hypothetical protein
MSIDNTLEKWESFRKKGLPNPYKVKQALFDYTRENKQFTLSEKPINAKEFADWYNENESSLKSILESINEKSSTILDIKEYRHSYPELNWSHPEIKYFTDELFGEELPDFELKDGLIQLKQYDSVVIEWECKSGKIIVDDWFSGLSRDPYDKLYANINTTVGIIKTIHNFSEKGILHGFVGNSSPGLYWNSEKQILEIGTEIDWEETEEPVNKSLREVGHVCTDLWWYSIMDYEEYKKRGGKDNDHWTNNIIEIPKGKYRLTHYYGVSTQEYHPNTAYAKLEKID